MTVQHLELYLFPVPRLGATIEELDAEVIRSKEVYTRAKKEFEELQRLNAVRQTATHNFQLYMFLT